MLYVYLCTSIQIHTFIFIVNFKELRRLSKENANNSYISLESVLHRVRAKTCKTNS